MADNYTVLHGKYQRALVTIREISQEKERCQKELEELQSSNAQVEKAMKYLCETIMKKDRSRRNEKTWFKMSLKDMIATAQESLESYFPSIEEMIKKLIANNAERTEKIAGLEEELAKIKTENKKTLEEQLRIKDQRIQTLKEKLKTGRMEEEDIDKLFDDGEAEKPDISKSLTESTEFEPEDTDNMDDQVAEAAEAMFEAGQLVIPAKEGPKVKDHKNTKNAVKQKVRELEEKKGKKISDYARNLTDPQKLLIKIMGQTGYSEMDQIVKAAKMEYPELKSESSIKASMHGLIQENEKLGGCIVEATKTPVPGSPNFCIYELTTTGREIYSYLFSKDAKEGDSALIKKAHGTYEHGYGIQRTASLIQEMPYIKEIGAEVEYMTRDKEHTIKTGDNSSYIPDIIIVIKKDGKVAKRYIEYETGKCNDTDFQAKCNKIASFSKYINIIVPNDTVKKEVIIRVEKWRDLFIKEGQKFPREDQVRIRISTFPELKDSLKKGEANRKFPWYWEKTITPPKNEGG